MTPSIYISEFHGCAYRIQRDLDSDGDYLLHTPISTDDTFSLDDDDWIEVDELALLGEDEDHRLHIEFVWDLLRRTEDGIFADPIRMTS